MKAAANRVIFSLPKPESRSVEDVAAWVAKTSPSPRKESRPEIKRSSSTDKSDRIAKVPQWKRALNEVFHRRKSTAVPKRHHHRHHSPRNSDSEANVAQLASPSSGMIIGSFDWAEDSSDSDSVSVTHDSVVKRSEEITSELDISRRTDLDEDTLEKWWVKQSTPGHKRIVLLLFMLVVFATAHFVAGVGWLLTPAPQQNAYLCDSAACKVVASDLLTKMNEVIDPCNDFFLFTCGKQWESSMAQKGNEPDDDWALVTAGHIYYDFSSSQTIGKMLRQNDRLISTFHKACMDIERRNSEKMDPYFRLLRFYGLHDAEKRCTIYPYQATPNVTYCDLPRIFYKVNDLLPEKLIKLDIDFDYELYTVTLRNDSTPHSVFIFGFDTYLSVVKNALTYLNDLGSRSKEYKTTWGDAASIDAYAKLFICAQLNLLPYSENGEVGPPLWDRNDATGKLSELCNYRNASGVLYIENGTIPALKWSDFLKDQSIYNRIASKNAVQDHFKFEEMVEELIGAWVPNPWSFQRPIENDDEVSVDLLFNDYNMMVRFLQWKLLRSYGHTLDENLDRIFWPITRHLFDCNWISACIWTMFERLPMRAQELYMRSVPPEDIEHIDTLIKSYYPEIDKLSPKFNFPKFVDSKFAGSAEQRRNLTKMAFDTLELTWPKKIYDSDQSNFLPTSNLRSLTLGLENTHFFNVIKLKDFLEIHQKMLLLRFETDIQWEANSIIKLANINRPVFQNLGKNPKKLSLVMPLGTYEPPYFGTKFPALDIGGVGRYAMRVAIDHATGEGMSRAISSTPGTNTSTIENYLAEKLKKVMEFAQKSDRSLWKIPGKPEMYNTLTTDVNSLYTEQLGLQLAIKLSYEVHEKIISQNEIAGKFVLPGLEKYNARKLLFISSAARLCGDYSPNTLKHMKSYGPLPGPVSVNLMAANSKEFSKVFGCKAGSRMNPTKKFNFYDD